MMKQMTADKWSWDSIFKNCFYLQHNNRCVTVQTGLWYLLMISHVLELKKVLLLNKETQSHLKADHSTFRRSADGRTWPLIYLTAQQTTWIEKKKNILKSIFNCHKVSVVFCRSSTWGPQPQGGTSGAVNVWLIRLFFFFAQILK